MKLFGLQISRSRNLQVAEQKSFSSAVMSFLRGDDGSEAGGATLTNAFVQSTWVYACVTAIARQIASTPFCITQGHGKGESKIESGPVFDLFNRPHRRFTRFEFWELLVCWLLLRGEAFLVPLDAQGAVVNLEHRGAKPAAFCLLDPANFQHVVQDGELVAWKYTAGGEAMLGSQVLLPGEVVHHKLTNPFNVWRGLAPLVVAHLPAQADYAAAQFHKGLMLNNADTGVIVTTDNVLDDQQREQIMAALKERKRKAGTADRPLFLTGGAKVEKPALSSADMQFLENRKFSRQEVCAIFGVPQEIIGFTEDANRSVSTSARLNFIENTCAPHGARIEASLLPLLRVFGPNLYAYFDFDDLPIAQAARLERVATATALFNMGVPFNDLNESLDLGLPSHPWGAKGYLPFALQEVGSASAGELSAVSGQPSAQPDSAAASLRAALSVIERASTQDPRPKTQSPIPHTCAASAEYAASIAGSVKAKESRLRRFFIGQRARVLAALDGVGKNCGTPERWVPNSQLSTFNSQLSRALGDIFDKQQEDQLLLKEMKPSLLMDLEFGGAQLWSEFGLGDFKLPPMEAIQHLRTFGTRLEAVNATTVSGLNETLIEGLTNGDTFEQLKDRVRAVFNDATDSRAETIALTETNTAVNVGRFTGLLESGVERKGWLAANIENSRPAHQQAGKDYADGIPVGDPFMVGGEAMMMPGDPAASPGNTINCRCHLVGISGEKSAPTVSLTYEAFLARRTAKGALGVSNPAPAPKDAPNPLANARKSHS